MVEFDVSGIKREKFKDIIYEWRKQYFKAHPRKLTYREKEIERVQRTAEMLKKTREGI